MMIHPYCKFKDDVCKERFPFLHQISQEIMYDMAEYCEDYKIPFVVTATVSTEAEDKILNRVSSTHRTARAFDLRTQGWTSDQIKTFTEYFENQFGHYGALGAHSGKEQLILHHDSGHGDHFHVQIAAQYAVLSPLSQAPKPL